MAGTLTNVVRLEETRRQLDYLQGEVSEWLVRRRQKDTLRL